MPIMRDALALFRQLVTRDYWVLASAVGTVLIGLASLPELNRKYHVPILLIGGACVLVGLFKGAKRAGQADLIQKETREVNEHNGVLAEKIKHFKDKRIFLITADLSEVQWQVRLVRQILFALRQRDYRVDTYVPSGGFDATEQDGHMATVLKNCADYEGGIVISMFSEQRRTSIEGFARILNLPLVLVDNIDHPEIGKTCYVGVKSQLTGRMAGEAALDISRHQKIERILVIAGREQVDRQNEFSKVVAAALPKCAIDVHTDGEFSRLSAFQVTRRWVGHALEIRSPYQVIFCTSDLMTLGCLDALREISRTNKSQLPLVIGHDGEHAVLHLLRISEPNLARVVVTSPEKMAEDVVDNLYSLLSEPTLYHKPRWAQPYLLPDKYLPQK